MSGIEAALLSSAMILRRQALLSDCDALQFSIYQHTMKSNSFDCYDVSNITNARVIQVKWKNSRDILRKKKTT